MPSALSSPRPAASISRAKSTPPGRRSAGRHQRVELVDDVVDVVGLHRAQPHELARSAPRPRRREAAPAARRPPPCSSGRGRRRPCAARAAPRARQPGRPPRASGSDQSSSATRAPSAVPLGTVRTAAGQRPAVSLSQPRSMAATSSGCSLDHRGDLAADLLPLGGLELRASALSIAGDGIVGSARRLLRSSAACISSQVAVELDGLVAPRALAARGAPQPDQEDRTARCRAPIAAGLDQRPHLLRWLLGGLRRLRARPAACLGGAWCRTASWRR